MALYNELEQLCSQSTWSLRAAIQEQVLYLQLHVLTLNQVFVAEIQVHDKIFGELITLQGLKDYLRNSRNFSLSLKNRKIKVLRPGIVVKQVMTVAFEIQLKLKEDKQKSKGLNGLQYDKNDGKAKVEYQSGGPISRQIQDAISIVCKFKEEVQHRVNQLDRKISSDIECLIQIFEKENKKALKNDFEGQLGILKKQVGSIIEVLVELFKKDEKIACKYQQNKQPDKDIENSKLQNIGISEIKYKDSLNCQYKNGQNIMNSEILKQGQPDFNQQRLEATIEKLQNTIRQLKDQLKSNEITISLLKKERTEFQKKLAKFSGHLQITTQSLKYSGSCINGEFEGYGILHENKASFIGNFKNGQKFGNGCQKYENGNSYQGQFVQNQKHGKGTYTHKGGAKFQGSWINGRKEKGIRTTFEKAQLQQKWSYTQDGKAIMTMSDNDRYEGEVRDGQFQGKGTYYYNNGDMYKGQWENDMANGFGVYSWAAGKFEGDQYQGNWKDDLKHGKGIYFYKNGDKYQGDFVNDRMQGYGIFIQANGKHYKGGWKVDQRNGFGVAYSVDGSVQYEGQWNNDIKLN